MIGSGGDIIAISGVIQLIWLEIVGSTTEVDMVAGELAESTDWMIEADRGTRIDDDEDGSEERGDCVMFDVIGGIGGFEEIEEDREDDTDMVELCRED